MQNNRNAAESCTVDTMRVSNSLCLWLICFHLPSFLQGAVTERKSPSIRHGKVNKGTVHVFVLAGQSNMEGHGDVDARDHKTNTPKNGTLLYQLHDPRTRGEFKKLWDDKADTWRNLTDVKVWFNEFGIEHGVNGSTIPGINRKDYLAGDLSTGYGAGGNAHAIGPELGFGFNLKLPKGDKALIIKTAWGGTELASNWRPPLSTTTFDPYCVLPKCNPYQVGHLYQVMIEDVERLLKPGVLGKIYPDLEGMTPDIAGFGWFQGWNDGCNVNATAAYETNMVHMIQDLRRAWKKPKLPASIAISGFGGWLIQGQGRTPPDCWDGPNATKIHCHCDGDRDCRRIDIMLSQIAAANLTRHPELECCVEAVETRNFYRPPEYSPSGQGFHFNHNSETYYLIGKAMAESMHNMMWSIDGDVPGGHDQRKIVVPSSSSSASSIEEREAFTLDLDSNYRRIEEN
ncbi:unnamed protein product [Cylindrotheca closterium]|uniref:Sialate O-acetylesterase domain-containing protein n=1 Tax=Cylindrotheca closterium TaxID=2856 RepID=A0AAD2FZF4_9STRA|nr:unnamed protein product [Cylindrotheca closterium]